MVKAKRIKELRKQVEKAERVRDPFGGDPNCRAAQLDDGLLTWRRPNADGHSGDNSSSSSSSSHGHGGPLVQNQTSFRFSIEYKPSAQDVSAELVQACLDIFEANMGELYRNSSFGLDMHAKKSELTHRKARYLLVFDENSSKTIITGEERGQSVDASTAAADENKNERLAAFVHFRYCLDDDEAPTCAVLYVYEIQVSSAFSGQGLGTRLMDRIINAARSLGLEKVMLTALKSNVRALHFYKKRLGFEIDDTDPSTCTCGEVVDYEILSKACTTYAGC